MRNYTSTTRQSIAGPNATQATHSRLQHNASRPQLQSIAQCATTLRKPPIAGSNTSTGARRNLNRRETDAGAQRRAHAPIGETSNGQPPEATDAEPHSRRGPGWTRPKERRRDGAQTARPVGALGRTRRHLRRDTGRANTRPDGPAAGRPTLVGHSIRPPQREYGGRPTFAPFFIWTAAKPVTDENPGLERKHT